MGLDYAVRVWHNKVRGILPYSLYRGQMLLEGKPKYDSLFTTTIQGEELTLYIYLDNETQKERLDVILSGG